MRFKNLISAVLAAGIILSGTCDIIPENPVCITAEASSKIGYNIKYHDGYTTLELTPKTKGNTLRYTTSGKTPTSKSKKYTKALKFTSEKLVRISEYNEKGKRMSTLNLKIKLRCMPVEISMAGVADGMVQVSLESDTEDAAIYYTLDGSEPDEKSDMYFGAFLASPDAMVKAVAVKEDYRDSTPSELDLSEIKLVTEYDDVMLYILDAVNKEREARGLDPVVLNPVLTAAAEQRADEIAQVYNKKHLRPDGEKWNTVLDEFNYDAKVAAENIGRNTYDLSTSVKRNMKNWMNSEAHRNNILNDKVTELGVGWEKNGEYYYYVQLFGKQK